MNPITTYCNDPVYFCDLSQCQPASALTRENRKKGTWKVFDYDTEALRGSMLHATMLAGAQDVRLPLKKDGWHGIYIGLYGGAKFHGSTYTSESELLRVKLTKDVGFTEIARESSNRDLIEEVFWRHADLDGQDIVLGQRTKGERLPAGVAYVKLVPLNPEEVAAIQRDGKRAASKRLIGQVDNHGLYGLNNPRTIEELLEHVDVYRDTDVFRLLWSAGGSTPGGGNLPEYFKIFDTYPRQIDEDIAESLNHFLREKNIDPLRVIIDRAHELALEIYLSTRLTITGPRIPYDDIFTSPYWQEHPEWACKLPDGRKIGRLSMAYPGARKCLVDYYRKLAAYNPDGVSMTFTRHGPYCLYEDPVIDDFKTLYGVDPRDLTQKDPRSIVGDGSEAYSPEMASGNDLVDAILMEDERVILHRCSYLTQLMREMRRAMDEEAKKLGRNKIPICVTIYGETKYDLDRGLDIKAWIREGLIDCIVGSVTGHPESYASLAKGTGIEVYHSPNAARHMPGTEYIRHAKEAYEAGADGMSFWDINVRHPIKAQWNVLSRLGHADELDALLAKAETKVTYHRLLTINGICPDEGWA